MIEPIKDFPPYLGPVYKIINRIILFLAPFHNIKGRELIEVRSVELDATTWVNSSRNWVASITIFRELIFTCIPAPPLIL